MPELPEVETTRRGLDSVITGQTLSQFVVHNPRMRWPVIPEMGSLIIGHKVQSCDRRGKYLLFKFSHGTQLVHLGMSGSLRRVNPNDTLLKHDHIEWWFNDARFVLHDPRRFGCVLWHPASKGPAEENHPLLVKLGIEPFDPEFTGAWLHKRLAGKKQAIKQALLGGTIVVGVGNIYASEALFKAGIRPTTAAGKISLKRCKSLVASIQQTLKQALESGGSTLRDYINATGEPGAYFELHAQVYDKEGKPCKACGTSIVRIVQGQRATYYCPSCQR